MSERRLAVLREMGLAPIWRLRSASGAPGAAEPEIRPAARAVAAEAMNGDERIAAAASPTAEVRPSIGSSSPAAGPAERLANPAERVDDPADKQAGDATDEESARAGRIGTLDWDALESDIRTCCACRLCERRRQAVPGVGDRQADWMFVGEGPGAEEDQRGEPFVGVAGRLLDAWLASIGLKRGENVYIANAVKCRPPHNRTPEIDELAACAPYLARQIELVRPRRLVALGRPAARALLNSDVAIGAARGQVFDYRDVPVIVTYHPAYLLRNPRDKAKVWEDLCFARRLMREATPS